MEHGDLLQYVQSNTVVKEEQVAWCHDVTKGLAHIHQQGLIHRDLAARNVMLSTFKVAKIGDYGLTRSRTYSNAQGETYYKSRDGTVAVRWSAPECFSDARFTDRSDVW
jgi:serine/threonine protein kinase